MWGIAARITGLSERFTVIAGIPVNAVEQSEFI